VKHFDQIDLLVNNAGIYVPKPFTAYTADDFELMIGTNVAKYFFVTQQVVAHMRRRRAGHVVGISTMLVDQPLASAAHLAARHHQVHGSGVQPRPGDGVRGRRDRANTISPGVVDTPMHANDDHEAMKKLMPIPRLVQISEIVDALLYLESAPMVNGENIRIDGGAHAGAKW
jgi:NAD(P)-dependent dehydrogenase (short-subunit alcohol dehydrogenase family)